MEIGDFSYFVFAPILLIPLFSVYVSLSYLKWEPRARVFLDSWLIFIGWLISTLFVCFGLVIATDRLSVFWNMQRFLWIALVIFTIFLGNFMVITVLVSMLNRRNRMDEVHITMSQPSSSKPVPNATQIAFVTSVACALSLIISFGIIATIGAIYDHYYPSPEVQFGIYDI